MSKRRIRVTLGMWMVVALGACICATVVMLLVIPRMRSRRERDIYGRTFHSGRGIMIALDMHLLDTGFYPSTDVGLTVLTNSVGIEGSAVDQLRVHFHYTASVDRRSYGLTWTGPDRTLGTKDDIMIREHP